VGKAWRIYDQSSHVSEKEANQDHVTSGSSKFQFLKDLFSKKYIFAALM
jgi:hypothetical protein